MENKKVYAIELKEGIKNGRIRETKEFIRGYYGLYINSTGQIANFIDVRFYMGRSSQSSVVYCFLWVHGGNKWGSGQGKAGGYGYDKFSAAFSDALSSAGISNTGIDGVGETAIKQAIQEIAEYFNFQNVFIQEAYG